MGDCALERMDLSSRYVGSKDCGVRYGREEEASGWGGESGDRLQVRFDVTQE